MGERQQSHGFSPDQQFFLITFMISSSCRVRSGACLRRLKSQQESFEKGTRSASNQGTL